MTLLQSLILGILQGITEFLPVSSSGHLVLAESFFGLHVEELLVFDVVLHAGTLVALLVYFRRTLIMMLKGLWVDLKFLVLKRQERPPRDPENPREQVWYLIIATVPVVLVGPLVKDLLEEYFRNANTVVMMLGLTALFLAAAEWVGKRTVPQIDSWKKALLMGLFQVFAMIPGVSRSGSTIVGGLFGGLTREAAARFSFLMAIPAIGGATVFLLKDIVELGAEQVSLAALSVGFLSSLVMSFICMWGMLKFLRKRSLWWFVGYLVLVNVAWFLFGSV